jgi:hypothetical protein
MWLRGCREVVDNGGWGVYGSEDVGVRWDSEAWIRLEDADFFGQQVTLFAQGEGLSRIDVLVSILNSEREAVVAGRLDQFKVG